MGRTNADAMNVGLRNTLKGTARSYKSEKNRRVNQTFQTTDTKHKCKQTGSHASGLYVSARINYMVVDCLVDTGATLTLVSTRLWNNIKHKHVLTPFTEQLSRRQEIT